MADAVKIAVEKRDPAKNKGTGSRVSRRLRKAGRIPAIVYGHKQEPQPISLPREAVWEMIKKSTHLAELDLGGSTETVVVRELQWDHLGKEIIHVDFARVSADESIHTEVKLDIRGTAPGTAEGGVLEIVMHSLDVTCRAGSIPDSIRIDVSGLHNGEAIHAGDLALPAGVVLAVPAELLLVHVVVPVAEPVVDEEPAVGTMPEVIKPERKDKDE